MSAPASLFTINVSFPHSIGAVIKVCPEETVRDLYKKVAAGYTALTERKNVSVPNLKNDKGFSFLPDDSAADTFKPDQIVYADLKINGVLLSANVEGKTLGEILEDCYIADVTPPQPARAKQPYFPYKLAAHVSVAPSNRIESERKYNRYPNKTNLEYSVDFEQKFNLFYQQPNAKLKVFISSAELPKAKDIERAPEINNEAVIRVFMSNPLEEVIFAHEYKNVDIKWEFSQGAGIFDIAFVDPFGNLKLLIECKHPDVARYETAKIVVDTFNQQNEEYDPSARPINQIVNYLLFNNVRYGILTTLRYNYAFERIGNKNGVETIRVSQVKKDVELLKLVFYLLHQSENHTEHEALPKNVVLSVENNQESNLYPEKLPTKPKIKNPNTTPDFIGCFDNFDVLADPDNMDRLFYDHFLQWQFKIGQTILGHGRTGCVTLGQAWSMDRPNHMYPVVVKIADLYKRPYLEDEMRNEARVLMYANNVGLKCVPKLRWAGYFGYGAQFYVICTEYIDGSHRDLDKLSENEELLFAAAQDELQSAAIIHGDIKKSNVVFTESQCYLVDYGMAKLYDLSI